MEGGVWALFRQPLASGTQEPVPGGPGAFAEFVSGLILGMRWKETVTGFFVCLFVCFFVFLGLHPWLMEVPRLGVELELQLLVYYSHSRLDP